MPLRACATERHGRRVSCPLATLPLCDPGASAAELERAMDELGMPGAMLFSNVNGIGLDDERFWPLYEVANDRDAVLMIHPTYPVGVEAMAEYWLMPLNGFLFDTTLAASKLVFSGVVKRFPAHPLGARPPRRNHPVPRRAARPRLARLQGVPRAHRSSRRPSI